ncbi:single-stranded DNA-binding protein [Leucobacter denitrificans]|uniref:Single-stranded DNA-binding protein n=1 Tax=Leucobacter denitrificans TaxID=683042 RepID=A0A7G9S634_9MICO|nr:single-stranded DNA-binding protein [Leucobacter denitrificans]QNN63309.1 single-stranded DNA-binding protein [Leucobacter denitrificans]
MSQHISAVGQIATEPKLYTPSGGVQFCTFRLASTERRFDAQRKEWVDGDTNWFTVNSFRSLAVNASASFSKGDRVVVTGRLRVRQWETDEKKGNSVEIDVDGIGHDVRWGVSRFTKQQVEQPTSSRESGTGTNEADGSAAASLLTHSGSASGQLSEAQNDASSRENATDSADQAAREPELVDAPF